jgi:DnaJ family protein A protein 2
MMAGDLILFLRENPHDVYTRKGSDLFIKKNIALIEALLGFNFTIAHLDGHEYTFYTHPGDIVGDGHKKVIKGLGMPFFDEPESRGNLIVEFKVVMPKRGELTAEQLKALSGALPGKINERPKGTNY